MGGRRAHAGAHGGPGSLRGVFRHAVLLFVLGYTFAYGDVSSEGWGGVTRLGTARVENSFVRRERWTMQLPITHPRFSDPLQSDCKSAFYGIPGARYKTYVWMA